MTSKVPSSFEVLKLYSGPTMNIASSISMDCKPRTMPNVWQMAQPKTKQNKPIKSPNSQALQCIILLSPGNQLISPEANLSPWFTFAQYMHSRVNFKSNPACNSVLPKSFICPPKQKQNKTKNRVQIWQYISRAMKCSLPLTK